MKFKSKKDILFQVLGGGIIILCLFALFSIIREEPIRDSIFSIVVLIIVLAFFLWSGFGTFYKLTDKKLFYRSGPFRGSIDIFKINEIIKGKTMWSGFKPATARNGLIIKYDKYNEIYISPNTNDDFINEILKINPNIKISSPQNNLIFPKTYCICT